jgi:glucose-6-phosphate isomerase
MDPRGLWARYRAWLYADAATGLMLDVSRMGLADDQDRTMAGAFSKAFAAMRDLESGAIANPDEQRMVGHYWLRAPELAPTPELAGAIRSTLTRILDFAEGVHGARIRPEGGERYTDVLTIGIGGSALGPQLVADALAPASGCPAPHFLDNTDPDGIDRVLGRLGRRLATTLTVVISKSGGTPETRNGMLETAAAYERIGTRMGPHAVAVTQFGSALDKYAAENRFIDRFPMWDWVGGRTSVLSAVGLLPAAVQGIDVGEMLAGAAAMDRLTRVAEIRRNPAALLAMSWHAPGGGRGAKDMVILPYKDRLALFSRYLQQLVMESLGKERDLAGNVVHQGIAVYGNKGSTDQHAYVQQLREGVPNFFATFIEVLADREGASLEVEPGATSGDFLSGFLQGTRRALYENGRGSVTITVPDVSPRTLGMLIALYERTVGFYATLVDVNAYHQPGVEAGKKAAAGVLDLQRRVVATLQAHGGAAATCEQIAQRAERPDEVETVFKILEHLAANPGRGVLKAAGSGPFDALYRWED